MYIKKHSRKTAPPSAPPEGGENFYPLFLPKAKIRTYNLSDKTKDSLKTRVFRYRKSLLPNEHGE